jgi:hypothetical protein
MNASRSPSPPTAEAGVLQLIVLNKSVQPINIVWTKRATLTQWTRCAQQSTPGPSGVFGTPGWPAGGTRIMPSEAFQVTLRPGGFRTARQPSLSPYAGQPDLRLPPDPEFQPSGRPMQSASANPFIVSRSTGGEVAVSTTPQPLLPTGAIPLRLARRTKGENFALSSPCNSMLA